MNDATLLRPVLPSVQLAPILFGLSALGAIAVGASAWGGWRFAALAVVGGFAGFALYHAAFGFTAAWRRMVSEGRGNGLRAQMLLLALTCAVTYPLIEYGSTAAGGSVGGFVFPFGWAVAIGAFLFGVGMQFGGGCGSGTLFTAGGGSMRMVVTLLAFIGGSLIATHHLHLWNALPRFEAVSLVRVWGPWRALLALLLACAAVCWITLRIERNVELEPEPPRRTVSLLRGTWSPWLGAVTIALVGWATYWLLGRPWGVTSGFALWGAQFADVAGIDVRSWPYWRGSGALDRSILADATSVQNLGIVAGAAVAAGMASRYRPTLRIAPHEIATAIAGGLLMGYGARLSFGCNIGAYLGGIASGSLHGPFWAVFAFAGSSLAVRWRMRGA